MESQAQLSAIIVSATEPRPVLAGCIEALRKGLPDCEIVVVDNGDSVERLADLEERVDNLKLVCGHGNVGYGRGNNLGVTAASGTHVLIVNPDAELVSVDRAQLERLLASDPLGIVAPLHLEPDGQTRYHVNPGDHWVSHFLTGQVLAPLQPRELRSRRRRVAPSSDGAWVGGSFVLLRKREFEALGGFDKRYFLYYEDRDLTNRYREAGLPVRTDASLVARHGEGASFGDEQADVRRSTWRIVGWLQYVCIWDGRRAAAAAFPTLLTTYVVLASLLTMVPAARFRRKARELRAVRDSVLHSEALLPPPAAGSYPDVFPMIAARTR